MTTHTVLASAICGYFLGSIPFGYLLVRLFRGADVRKTGSGNIGATNVARTSPALGLLTLLLDFLKGLAAVWLASRLFPGNLNAEFAAALAAIAGHVFPVWLGFRGGKGVATGLGSFVLLTPKSILIAVGVFVLLVAAFRYVSLASLASSAALLVSAVLLGEAHGPMETTFVVISCVLIMVKHHKNIQRLLSGVEPKFHARNK